MKLFTIKDKVSGTFGVPFAAVNLGDAVRKVAVSYKDNPFKDDLQLFYFGDMDDYHMEYKIVEDNGVTSSFCGNVSDIVESYFSEVDNA